MASVVPTRQLHGASEGTAGDSLRFDRAQSAEQQSASWSRAEGTSIHPLRRTGCIPTQLSHRRAARKSSDAGVCGGFGACQGNMAATIPRVDDSLPPVLARRRVVRMDPTSSPIRSSVARMTSTQPADIRPGACRVTLFSRCRCGKPASRKSCDGVARAERAASRVCSQGARGGR